jgi:hypothetical protein
MVGGVKVMGLTPEEQAELERLNATLGPVGVASLVDVPLATTGRSWTRAIAENIAPFVSSKPQAVDAMEGALNAQYNDIAGFGRAAANSYSAGFGDEILGIGDTAARDKWRQDSKDFAANNPWTSFFGNIAGGAVSPINKIAMAAKIPGVAPIAAALPAYLGTALNVGTQAAIQGYGEGEGDWGRRLGSAATSGIVGSAFGGGGSIVGGAAIDRLGPRVDPIIKKIAELTGFDAPSRQMIEAAATRLEDATKAEIPGYAVIDALQPAYVPGAPTSKSTIGAYVRGATKGSLGDGAMADAHTLIYSRLPSPLQSTEKVLDAISPGLDPEDAKQLIVKASRDAIKDATTERAKATEPLYEAIKEEFPTVKPQPSGTLFDFTPTVKTEADQLIKNKYVKDELNKIRARYAPEDVKLGAHPEDWSTDTWIGVRSRLQKRIQNTLNSTSTTRANDAADMGAVLDSVDGMLGKLTGGKTEEAKALYAAITQSQPEVFDPDGIIARLAKTKAARNTLGATQDVWGNTAKSTKNVGRIEARLGNDVNRAGFRAVSSEMLPDRKFSDAAKTLLESDRWNQQAERILSAPEVEDLVRKLNYLHTISDNNNFLTGNSTTASEVVSSLQDAPTNLKPNINPLQWIANAIAESRGMLARDTRNKMLHTVMKSGDEGIATLNDVAKYMDAAQLYRDSTEPVRQVGLSTGRNIGPNDIMAIIKGFTG